MFLLIPFALVLASAGGIFFILWRKLPRLKELTEFVQQDQSKSGIPNGASVGRDWLNVFYDFCPEIVDLIKNIKVNEYKEMWLVEVEKFLRRLRIVSLKMDRLSDTLIKKIRKSVYSNDNPTYAEKEQEKNGKNKLEVLTQENNREELKKTEQRLILEIAKNPKSVVLYEDLGDVYIKMGDYQDAKEAYEAAMELNPQSESLKQKLSSALEKLNSQTRQ